MWHSLDPSCIAWSRLNFHQATLLVIAIVAFGCFCLRGFGSRSNY